MRMLSVSNLSLLVERDQLSGLFAGHGTVRPVGLAEQPATEPGIDGRSIIDRMDAPSRGGFGRSRQSPWPRRARALPLPNEPDAGPLSARGAAQTKGVALAND